MKDKYGELIEELLDACKGQHDAIDRLFAELIKRDRTFFPSKSGMPWEAAQKGNNAIHKTEELLQELGDACLIKVDGFQSGCLMGLIMEANLGSRMLLGSVWEQLLALKKKAEEEAGVVKEILPGGMIRLTDKDGNVITREALPWETE